MKIQIPQPTKKPFLNISVFAQVENQSEAQKILDKISSCIDDQENIKITANLTHVLKSCCSQNKIGVEMSKGNGIS